MGEPKPKVRRAPGRSVPTSYPSLFDYADWREWLRAWISTHKRIHGLKGVSRFARAAGCSPGHVTNVVCGRKRLRGALVERFGLAAGLQGPMLECWRLLVLLTEGTRFPNREWIEDELARLKAEVQAAGLDRLDARAVEELRAALRPMEGSEADRYMARWCHPVLYALADCPDFTPELELIRKTLFRGVTTTEARAALTELESLGLLTRTASGELQATAAFQHLRGPFSSQVYKSNHDQDLQQALEVLLRRPPECEYVLERLEIAPEAHSDLIERAQRAPHMMIEDPNREAAPGRVCHGGGPPPEGAPRPDRVLETAMSLVVSTGPPPPPPAPPPPPPPKRRGRPPKTRLP